MRQVPPDVPMRPVTTVLPAGAELWRCHATSRPVTDFNPVPSHRHVGGGRFDGADDDRYRFLYAAFEPLTALAETLLRDIPYGETGVRPVPWVTASSRSLSKARVTEDLRLVRLVSQADLAAVFQDTWLLEGGDDRYGLTRYWAQEIRRHAPDAQGMVWQSRRNRPHHALVLFGDRCGDEPLKAVPEDSYALGTFEGAERANQLLAPLRAFLLPPGMRT
ncbi:RES family NAD+ phosphorylase [Streptomyces yaizuensis]|uniref:RES family NAD+ phosphorylase n=1 Tax=Streptomyces yaizuensis TaxID=2989713 RepID=A0ABQ5P1U8_9ACTN|nr:RES family NAD+ phosphorylase [Streptomyces sp. YSPA8]GLF96583.1 RES family NAD+ phosphorylase [Streptomyces sp. YSPA8]